MGLFKGLGNWEDNLTEEDIDLLESKGSDVTELRKKFASRQADIEKAGNTNLSKLEAYKTLPYDVNSEFFKLTAGKAPLFGKAKWRDQMVNAPIVYAAVVQGHPDLWTPADNELYNIVVVVANDPLHKADVAWLENAAEKVEELRDAENYPKECKRLVKCLNDPDSFFTEKLPAELFDGAELWCGVVTIMKQNDLPNGRIPNNRILAFTRTEEFSDGRVLPLNLIPGKFYQA